MSVEVSYLNLLTLQYITYSKQTIEFRTKQRKQPIKVSKVRKIIYKGRIFLLSKCFILTFDMYLLFVFTSVFGNADDIFAIDIRGILQPTYSYVVRCTTTVHQNLFL